jgi:hypothetical protein
VGRRQVGEKKKKKKIGKVVCRPSWGENEIKIINKCEWKKMEGERIEKKNWEITLMNYLFIFIFITKVLNVILRACLDRFFFVFVLVFLRDQCKFIVWIENFETQILKY